MQTVEEEYELERNVELDVGGRRFHTSMSVLRSKPGTFFGAMFSGLYDIERSEDGSIFVDRDGELFGHVLEYLRDGVVNVAKHGAPVHVLRKLKREFNFFSIELYAEKVQPPNEVTS
jgi:hypothetical protein